MISRSLALGLLAAGCVTAAGGGAYLAVRQNAAKPVAPAITAPVATPADAAQQPVSETEAVITPANPTATATHLLGPTCSFKITAESSVMKSGAVK